MTNPILLQLCPICLGGPVVRRGKSRIGGLLTKPRFVCGICGSVLEPVGDKYRYRKISTNHGEMSNHGKTVSYSLEELRDLSQRRLERVAGEEERQKQLAAEQETKRRLQPRTLREFIGQEAITEYLSVSIQAAQARGEALGHVLLSGPEACGKKTLALIIAHEMGVKITVASATPIERAGDLAEVVMNLGERDILLVEHAHRLRRAVRDRLCPAMQEYALDIVLGRGLDAKTIHLPLPHFTLIAATDQRKSLSRALKSQFQHICEFQPYDDTSVARLIQRRAEVLAISLDEGASREIARGARGDMREANRLLDRARDVAQVRAHGVVTIDMVRWAVNGTVSTADQPETEPLALTWQEFESFVARLFSALGYEKVRLTPRAGDEGKDIVMEWADPLRGSRRLYVECKHWQANSVGRRDVQILHSAVMANPAVDEGVLVTTGRFTDGAVDYAKQVGVIQLIDRKKLRELMTKAGILESNE